jgi:hypothetical protein
LVDELESGMLATYANARAKTLTSARALAAVHGGGGTGAFETEAVPAPAVAGKGPLVENPEWDAHYEHRDVAPAGEE